MKKLIFILAMCLSLATHAQSPSPVLKDSVSVTRTDTTSAQWSDQKKAAVRVAGCGFAGSVIVLTGLLCVSLIRLFHR